MSLIMFFCYCALFAWMCFGVRLLALHIKKGKRRYGMELQKEALRRGRGLYGCSSMKMEAESMRQKPEPKTELIEDDEARFKNAKSVN